MLIQRYGCFLKWWYPQNSPKWSFLVGKPMVVVLYHHFRKHPYGGQLTWNTFFHTPTNFWTGERCTLLLVKDAAWVLVPNSTDGDQGVPLKMAPSIPFGWIMRSFDITLIPHKITQDFGKSKVCEKKYCHAPSFHVGCPVLFSGNTQKARLQWEKIPRSIRRFQAQGHSYVKNLHRKAEFLELCGLLWHQQSLPPHWMAPVLNFFTGYGSKWLPPNKNMRIEEEPSSHNMSQQKNAVPKIVGTSFEPNFPKWFLANYLPWLHYVTFI